MKKVKILSNTGLMCLWVLLLVYQTSHAQSPYTGIWEGNCISTKYQVLNREFPTYFHMWKPLNYPKGHIASKKKIIQL